MMIMSGYLGPQIWHTPFSELCDLPEFLSFVGDYSARQLLAPNLLSIFLIAHLPSCVLNVKRARQEQGLPFLPALLDWTPMLIYTAATVAWLSSPYSIVLGHNHLALFCITQSFVFGRMTTKIILAHLTRQPFPYWTVLMAPLVGGAILTNLPRFGYAGIDPETELLYLWGYLGFSMIVYFRWAVLVISAITEYLGINCLTIPAHQLQAIKAANGKIA